MKTFTRSLALVASLSALATISGCNATAPGPGQSDLGSIGVALQLASGAAVNAFSYTITGPASFSKTGSVDVSHSATLTFTVGALPAGAGYSIAVTGASSDATVTCAGSAVFGVTARATTNVAIVVDCHLPTATGSVLVNGAINLCPVIDGVSASPASAFVGSTIALAGTAHDVDMGPSTLSYLWTATAGSFDDATSQTPVFTCVAAGTPTITLTVSDGDPSASCAATSSVSVSCTTTAGGGGGPTQALSTSLDPGVAPIAVTINQGTAIGQGSGNGATPSTLTNLAADPANTQTLVMSGGDFLASGTVPDTAAGFCTYATDGTAPKRASYVTGAKFETVAPGSPGADPMVPMAPFYFPLVYNTVNTTTGNAFGGQAPIIGLFDWRPKDIDEAVVAAESDDNGRTWFFMQTVLELNPDFTNPSSGGFSATSTNTGCPATITSTNASFAGSTNSEADDGWGHATVLQLPGPGNVKTGQFIYLLDRKAVNVDVVPLHAINITGSSNKFPVWNTNSAGIGANDIKSISTALANTPGTATPFAVQDTVGLLNPDGIMAVFPTPAATPAGTALTVLYVQKILNGDNTGATALPVAQQCAKAPFSGKTNHDIANVRLATTTDGINFTDLGIVQGLSDPTTVDYTKTRWVSPRGTLLDINGDGSLWGLYFSAGNCLDGDSDAFHYIGYAESTDKVHWTVFNDINNPIASINPITTANQAGGATVTIPAHAPVVPTQAWFAERLYAPTATRIDATHLSMTFAGYGVQTPNNDLLAYRQIGNVTLTLSKALPAGVPNNINAH
ncbi:MAG TPA: hypothetical protein VLA14_03525 [Polyangia bacterium]|nr:hypothetical protein [Polyangia bacterium]